MWCLIWQPDTLLLIIAHSPFPLLLQGLQFKTKTGQTLWDSAWIAGVHCNEEEDDADCGNEGVELPGVEICEQEEEQLWEDLDKNTTANLLDDAESPIQPDPQVDEEDIKEQQEAEEIRVKAADEEDQDDQEGEQEPAQRRPTRVRNPPSERLNTSSASGQSCSGIEIKEDAIECESEVAQAPAQIVCLLSWRHATCGVETGAQSVATCALNQAVKKWQEKASDAALKEMKQCLC